MIDEAIDLINKERDMYEIQLENINNIGIQMKTIDYINIRNNLSNNIKVRDFILKILEKHKKEDTNE